MGLMMGDGPQGLQALTEVADMLHDNRNSFENYESELKSSKEKA